MNSCDYKWQSQPPLGDIKGAGNLLFTAGIFFLGIPFAKFESFSSLINLKFIGKGTYYNLREQYVFPVVKSTWEEDQAKVFSALKSRESGAVLAVMVVVIHQAIVENTVLIHSLTLKVKKC